MLKKKKWLFSFVFFCSCFMFNNTEATSTGYGSPVNHSVQSCSTQEVSKGKYDSVKEYVRIKGEPVIVGDSGRNDTMDLSGLGLKSLYGLQNLSNVSQVQVLDLRNNCIADIPEGIFTPFQNIHTLYLQDNQLHFFHKGSFHGLSKLKKLVIFNNPLKKPVNLDEWVTSTVGQDVAVFWKPFDRCTGGYSIADSIKETGQPKLTNWVGPTKTQNRSIPIYGQKLIDLSNQGFTNADGLQLLENPGEVQVLDLSNNQISCIPRGLLKKFSNLTTLIVSHNCLRTFPWDDLKELASLRQVTVSHNQLLESPNGKFRQLESLELDHNCLSTLDLFDDTTVYFTNRLLVKWKLKKLWLNNNNFTKIPEACHPSVYRRGLDIYMMCNPIPDPDDLVVNYRSRGVDSKLIDGCLCISGDYDCLESNNIFLKEVNKENVIVNKKKKGKIATLIRKIFPQKEACES